MKYKVSTPRGDYTISTTKDVRDTILKKEKISYQVIDEGKPEIINIINRLPWYKSNGTMKKEKIDTVVVHHDAQHRPAIYPSVYRYQKQAKMHAQKGWGHYSYHYVIDNVGDIFQCLPETEVGYHAGNLTVNRKSIAIKFDGNMETQKLTSKQIESYKQLMHWLTTQRPDLPKLVKGSEKPHRKIKATACPGKNTLDVISKY